MVDFPIERMVLGDGNRFLAHDSADEGDETNRTSFSDMENLSTSVCMFSYPIHCLTRNPILARDVQKDWSELDDLGTNNVDPGGRESRM